MGSSCGRMPGEEAPPRERARNARPSVLETSGAPQQMDRAPRAHDRYKAHSTTTDVTDQIGMFSFTGLNKDQVNKSPRNEYKLS